MGHDKLKRLTEYRYDKDFYAWSLHNAALIRERKRGNSWKYTIKHQRFEIRDFLEESPSLNCEFDDQLSHAYEKALIIAVEDIGLSPNVFPKTLPFSLSEALDENFFPE